MANDWIAVLAMAVIATIIPVSMLMVNKLIRPSVPEKQKHETYESGEIPTGDARSRFDIQYYLIAILFLVFDVEAVLLFPWLVVFTDLKASLLPAILFIAILMVPIGWAWRSGTMDWVKPVR